MDLRKLKTDLGADPPLRLKRWFNRVARKRLAAGKWVCDKCTYSNSNDAAKRCYVCLARRRRKKRKTNRSQSPAVGEESDIIDLTGATPKEEKQVIDLSSEDDEPSPKRRRRASRGFYPSAPFLKKINLRKELKRRGLRYKKDLVAKLRHPGYKTLTLYEPRVDFCYDEDGNLVYFEKQKFHMCGMHAVNNLAGYPRFSARDWFDETHEKDEDGNFDTGTVEKMLKKHFGKKRVTMSNKLPILFQSLHKYLGFVVLTREEEGHYVCFRQDDHGWLFFNSLGKGVYRLKDLQFLKHTIKQSCKHSNGRVVFCDTYLVLKDEPDTTEGTSETDVDEDDVQVIDAEEAVDEAEIVDV